MSDTLVERHGAIATVVINRPRLGNAISYAARGERARVTRALGDDVYLEGCAGARRERLRALAREALENQDYTEGMRAFLDKRPPSFQGR